MRRRLRPTLLLALVAALGLLLTGTLAAAGEDPPYVEVTKLLASNPNFGDFFGEHLAIDGDTLVIVGDSTGQGGGYIFERNGGGSNAWGEVAKLVSPDPTDDLNNGVAIDGNLIALGGPRSDQSGVVFVFERDAGGPGLCAPIARFVSPDEDPDDDAFWNPAIDGNTLAVGATGDSEGAGFGTGAVFAYERDETAPQGWRYVQKLIASDPNGQAKFGYSLDIDGDLMVVGAARDDSFAIQGGSAWVFRRGPEGVWDQVASLKDPAPEDDGHFGEGVAVEGDTVVVGNPGEDSNAGALHVFGRDIGGPSNWGLEAVLQTADSDNGNSLGVSVEMDDGRIVAGAPRSNPTDGRTGALHVFERGLGGEWVEVARLVSSDGGEDWLGEAVGVQGGTVVGGAAFDDEGGFDAGAAFVFQAVAHPGLAVTGACPGKVTLTLTGATPGGGVFVGRSTAEGVTPLPEPCDHAELGLKDPSLLLAFLADEEGSESHERVVPEGACGLFLQAVDRTTCGVGPLSEVPPSAKETAASGDSDQ